MSKHPYSTQPLPPLQEVDLSDEAWNHIISTRLPAQVEEQARTLGAWSRQRKLRCATDLLRALLVYAACQYSFRELGMWAVLKGIGSLSERAWRKRFERSQEWIAWLLSYVLGVHQRPAWLPTQAGRVLIVDASRWKTPGGCGDDVRLHQCYDLHAGCMHQVQVTDRHEAEGLSHFGFQAGDLVMTDAGYPVASGVEQTQQSQSYVVQRACASSLRLEDEDAEVMKVKKQVQGQRGDSVREVNAWVRTPSSGERVPVRLVCYRLPREQAMLARQRKEAKLRKKHGRKYNRETVWWASWVLLVTTTPSEVWSGQDLVRLYRARWQIELFFKRLKQCLRLHGLDFKDLSRARCVLHLNLLVWWLQEQEAQWMREVFTSVLMAPSDETLCEEEADLAHAEVLSSWTLAHFCSEEVRTMLRGAWSQARKQQCRDFLLRYVRSRSRPRGHRESEQRAWLQARATQFVV